MIDTSKMIRYPCQCSPTCGGILTMIPHHAKPEGMLQINGVASVILPQPAFLALWNAMSDYMVTRCAEEFLS